MVKDPPIPNPRHEPMKNGINVFGHLRDGLPTESLFFPCAVCYPSPSIRRMHHKVPIYQAD